jgi:hypothetical protein
MDSETTPISEGEARMRQLESNFADLHVTLQLFLTQQANMQAPNVLPSISNPASKDSCTTPIPETPRERVSSMTDTRHIKPSSPNEFGGDRTKGQAFLNSCELYTALAPHQFVDDQAKIMWALSFMKSGHAARFVERKMWDYHNVGSLSYGSWQEFVDEFIAILPKKRSPNVEDRSRDHEVFPRWTKRR